MTFAVEDAREAQLPKAWTILPWDASTAQGRLRLEEYLSRRLSLHHPCLIPALDFEFRGRSAGLITPALPSETLLERAEDLSFSLPEALQTAEALCELHRLEIYCGSLHPGSLFRDREGRLIAHFTPHRPGPDGIDEDLIRYAAPEFIRTGRAGQAGDIYSLGMIFYHLFCGFPPFPENDALRLRQKQMMASPAAPRELNPEIPPDLEQLILSMIRKRPPKRPKSCLDIARSLRALGATGKVSPPVRTPLLGREAELDRFRRIAECYSENRRPASVLVESGDGGGRTALMQRLEMVCRLYRIPVLSLSFDAPQASAPIPGRQGLAVFCHDLDRFDEARFEELRVFFRNFPGLLFVADRRRTTNRTLVGAIQQLNGSELEVWDLEPFTKSQTRRLLSGAAGEAPAALVERVQGEAGGRPYYLVQVLGKMRLSGEIRYRGGRWEWSRRRLQNQGVPEPVRQRVAAVLESLPAGAQDLFRVLSLIERPIRVSCLSRVLNRETEGVPELVAPLESLGWVHRGGRLASETLESRMQWVKAAVSQSMGRSARTALHRRIARSLEPCMSEEAPLKDREELVHQYLRSRQWRKAGDHFRRVLAALEAKPYDAKTIGLLEEGASSPVGRWPIQSKLLALSYKEGRMDRCIGLCNRLLRDLEKEEATRRLPEVLAIKGRSHLLRGESRQALDALDRALPLVADLEGKGVENEVRSELLGCLVYLGDTKRAEDVFRTLNRSLTQRRETPGYDKVCHALFLYEYYLRDRIEEALRWDAESIRRAIRSKQWNRSAGRILGLAKCFLELGDLEKARRWIDFVQGATPARGNPSLEDFANCAQGYLWACQGRSHQALERLQQLLSLERLDSNLRIGAHIGAAQCRNEMLEPEAALAHLDDCEVQLDRHFKFPSAAEWALIKSWTLALLGSFQGAFRILDGFEWKGVTYQLGRRDLVRSRIHLLLGEWGDARRYSVLAQQRLAPRRRLERAEASLVRARAERRLGRLKESRQLSRAVRREAAESGWIRLEAEACLLRSDILLAEGEPEKARAWGLRSLRVARRIQSDGLMVRTYRQLGRANAATGRTSNAFRDLSSALEILEKKLIGLAPGRRRPFAERFMLPLEKERNRLFPAAGRSPSRYRAQIRNMTALLNQGAAARQAFSQALSAIHAVLPVSANAFLPSESRRGFDLVASKGRCTRPGRHLLPPNDGASEVDSPPAVFGRVSKRGAAIRIYGQGRLKGLIYLEFPSATIHESDLDFLNDLADLLQHHFQRNPGWKEAPGPPGRPVGGVGSESVVGKTAAMMALLDEARRVAQTGATVLISGESGTGKELLARYLHDNSARARGPFVAVNCSGLPDELIESELFGHVRGSFTGADRDRAGLFEAAGGGTLFLDEVSGASPRLQSSLLRALQERRVRRIGERRERPVDVRVISATNRSLLDDISRGAFRRDLYHRLNVCPLSIPPLRRRKADIPRLCDFFLKKLSEEGASVKHLAPVALSRLCEHDFPGNVRELFNVLESVYHLANSEIIGVEAIDRRLESSESTISRPLPQACGSLVADLAEGRSDFWTSVRDPFLRRDLSRRDVRQVISMGLEACQGRYCSLVEYFGMPRRDYKRFLGFLSNHDCKVDFRPFRERRSTGA